VIGLGRSIELAPDLGIGAREGRSAMGGRLAVALTCVLTCTVPVLAACSGSDSDHARARISARLSVPRAITGESVEITGATPGSAREVVLQRLRDDAWHDVSRTRASGRGHYTFSLRAAEGREVFRVLAPSYDGPGGHRQERSRRLPVTAVAPTADLEVTAAPVGATVDGEGSFPVEAVLRPKRPGAPVTIQARTADGWTTVARGAQDAAGRFGVNLAPSRVPRGTELRVVARPVSDLPRVRSSAARVTPAREVWRDDFDGDRLDPGKWRTRIQRPSGRRLCSTPAADRVSVRDGHAVLSIKRVGAATSACPEGVFTNAMIGTSVTDFPGFTATYGVFAARVKFQSGRGQHGSFWLQSLPESSETGAEIDVAEYFGDGRADGGLSNFVHHTSADGKLTSAGGIRPGSKGVLGPGVTPADSWHVYSLEWSPSGYVFRLDGVPTLRTSKPYVARTPEFMVLSLLTSDWELPALTSTTPVMKVDWVRAWQE
jgi:hypothetical protein